MIGIIGYSASVAGSVPMLSTSSQSETIIIQLSGLLGQNGFLLSIIAGIVLAGILASTMSTADSHLLTAAFGISQNLLQDFLKIKMDTKTSMRAARLTVIGIALVAVVLAWNPDSSVFTIVSFAWAGFGASFGPVMLFALFWKRSNLPGAIAGMVVVGNMASSLWAVSGESTNCSRHSWWPVRQSSSFPWPLQHLPRKSAISSIPSENNRT